MAQNPETIITRRVRSVIEARGGHFIKLSDSYTRGVPDAIVTTNRLVAIEFKVDRTTGRDFARSYSSLGLSGAQDHIIRAIARRSGSNCAYVVTDTLDGGRLRAWTPTLPNGEGPGYELYTVVAVGDAVYKLIGL
jgi:hypothetical protein